MPRRLSHLSDLVRVGEHGSKAISEIRRLTMRHESSRPGRLHTIGHAPNGARDYREADLHPFRAPQHGSLPTV